MDSSGKITARSARLSFTLIAWLMSVLMVLTPTTVTLADAFHDAANQGRDFGRAQVPDPKTTFKTDGNGGYVLSTGDGKTVHVTPQDVFGSGLGTVDGLKNLWGDNDAIHKKTQAVQQQLQTGQSEYAKAYRVLKSSSQRAHPDLSNDPIWDTSRSVMTDIFKPGGAYSACEVTKHVTEDKFTTHLPEYRTCNRIPAAGGSCTVKHDYEAQVIEHASGPLNIQSCGDGCRDVWLGHNREGIIPEQPSSCFIYEYPSIGIRVLNPDAITSVKLSYVEVDDRLQLWVDGTKAWQGPDSNFPPETGGSCDLHPGGSFHLTPNADITSYFKNAAPGQVIHLKIRVSVGGHDGNGYARLKLHFDPHKQITKDDWAGLTQECQSKIDAVRSGFASGSVACTDQPATSGGCATLGDAYVCEPDFKPSPISGISPLCRQVTVHSDLDFNKGQMDCWTDPQGEQHCPVNSGTNPDNCGALESNPSCRFLSSECVDGAKDGQGNCYAYTVRYDCGQDVDIPSADETSTYTCPGGIGCMGSACIDTTAGTNHDFAHAVAALQAADYMSMDMNCPRTQENNIDPNTCTVFKGEASECKIAVGGQVNCCDTPDAGVSLGQYITLLSKTRKIAGLVTGEGGVLHGAWTKITKPVTDAWGSVTSYFSSAVDTNASATPTHMIGLEKLEQMAMKKTANFLVNTFGESTADLFFSASAEGGASAGVGDVASGAQQGTVSLGGAVGSAVSVVMWAYTAYVVAKLLISVIWKCEKPEFELGAKRKLKSAHYIGSYCKSKVLGACIEKRKSYCVFNSPLSRILQEQIRAQLGISWGSSKHPDCRALTVAEINEVDWDKINLDEWLAILQTTGHMPQSPADAMSKYSMKQLTQNTETLNFDGKREDTATRNQQRLDNDDTLHRNEALRQSLWNDDAGSGQANANPPPPENRPSPCHPGTKVYNYTGNMQEFTVPSYCRRLDVLVDGADSGGADTFQGYAGQHITNQLTVNPGDMLPINVGRGGRVVSYWDDGHHSPGYYGKSGGDSAIYQPDNQPWVVARGGHQTGSTSQRPSEAWIGRNGRVVIHWGPGGLDTPTPVQPTPQSPPAPAQNPCHSGRRTYYYTGGFQSFTVPAACTRIFARVDGADSGSANNVGAHHGQHKTVVLPVTPWQQLKIYVGKGGKLVYDNGWVGRAGQGSTIYNASMAPWVSAAGGSQTGHVHAQPGSAWTGRNGWVVLRWGSNPPRLSGEPGRIAQAVPPPPCTPGTRVFNYASGLQSFTVPQSCRHLDVIVDGAQGGGIGGWGDYPGQHIVRTLSVSNGEYLRIGVGQGGEGQCSYIGGGGGDGKYGGGGGGGKSGGPSYSCSASGGGASIVYGPGLQPLVSANGGGEVSQRAVGSQLEERTGNNGHVQIHWRK